MKFTVKILTFIVFLLMFAPLASAETSREKKENIPDLLSSIKIDGPVTFCGEPVPWKEPEVMERLEMELLLMLWDRAQVIIWLKRGGRYLPYVEEQLNKRSLPDDLKYVMVIESSLRPHAGSSKGALGFWQFMEGTGKEYGLKIDARKDERRNIYHSTRAALDHLEDLHDALGSWTLAAAAYNMGKDGLRTEMVTQGVNDFYRLHLPLETQRYVLRAAAAKMIMSHPVKYGFSLEATDLYPSLDGEQIEVQCAEEIPLRVIARAAGTDFKTIKDMNPEIRGYYLARGSHVLLVPRGAALDFSKRFEMIYKSWQVAREKNSYVVQKGDTLSSIAAAKGVTVKALTIWNRLDRGAKLSPGEVIFIEK